MKLSHIAEFEFLYVLNDTYCMFCCYHVTYYNKIQFTILDQRISLTDNGCISLKVEHIVDLKIF